MSERCYAIAVDLDRGPSRLCCQLRNARGGCDSNCSNEGHPHRSEPRDTFHNGLAIHLLMPNGIARIFGREVTVMTDTECEVEENHHSIGSPAAYVWGESTLLGAELQRLNL